MSVALHLLFVFEISAAVMVAGAVPLWLRRVRPNAIYGFRTRKTLADSSLWALVNHKTGFDLLVVGLVLGVVAAGLFLADVSPDVFAFVCAGWVVAGVVFSLAHGLLLTRSAG